MASGNSNPTRTGAFIGTGALVTIATPGFRPKKVTLINAGDPGIAHHIDGMDDDSCYLDDGTPALVTSDTITLTDDGFTVGTNAALNTSGEQVFWIALG